MTSPNPGPGLPPHSRGRGGAGTFHVVRVGYAKYWICGGCEAWGVQTHNHRGEQQPWCYSQAIHHTMECRIKEATP